MKQKRIFHLKQKAATARMRGLREDIHVK